MLRVVSSKLSPLKELCCFCYQNQTFPVSASNSISAGKTQHCVKKPLKSYSWYSGGNSPRRLLQLCCHDADVEACSAVTAQSVQTWSPLQRNVGQNHAGIWTTFVEGIVQTFPIMQHFGESRSSALTSGYRSQFTLHLDLVTVTAAPCSLLRKTQTVSASDWYQTHRNTSLRHIGSRCEMKSSLSREKTLVMGAKWIRLQLGSIPM